MTTSDAANIHPEAHTAIDLLALEHVALAVADADAMAAFLCDHVGMQRLGRRDGATLVGADARATKLVLLSAEGPREPGALHRLVLRVADLQRAVASLPADIEVHEDAPDLVTFEGPEGLGIGFTLVAGGGIDFDVDQVVLHVADPEQTRIALAELGCVPRGDTLHITGKRITLEELPAWTDRPLLDHIAVRVESLEPITAQARQRGLDIARADDALTVVVPGAEKIRLEFVDRGSDDD